MTANDEGKHQQQQQLPRETYYQSRLRHFRERVKRFEYLLQLRAPAKVLQIEGGMIISAVLGIAGGGALGEVGNKLVEMSKERVGLCALHKDDLDHSLDATGQCGKCDADLATIGLFDGDTTE